MSEFFFISFIFIRLRNHRCVLNETTSMSLLSMPITLPNSRVALWDVNCISNMWLTKKKGTRVLKSKQKSIYWCFHSTWVSACFPSDEGPLTCTSNLILWSFPVVKFYFVFRALYRRQSRWPLSLGGLRYQEERCIGFLNSLFPF